MGIEQRVSWGEKWIDSYFKVIYHVPGDGKEKIPPW
jgi:hypothetical protein